VLLVEQGRGDEGIPHLQRAVDLGHKRPEPFVLMGRAHKKALRLVEAEQAYRRALQLDPGFADARLGLGNVLHDLGDLDAAVAEVRRVVQASPQAVGAHSNLAMKLLYHDGTTPEQMAEDHKAAGRAYMAAFASGGDPAWQKRDPDPERRLRIGYLSPDFRMHAVAFLVEPLLAAHDPDAVEVFGYSTADRPDAMTDRLHGLTHAWRDVAGVSVRDVAARIAEDRIDILVDLAGHTKNHRISVLAMKPAPLQVTWLGYPHGTGLPTVDYRLTDEIADPPGLTESHYLEELVRLPEGHFCYQPPPDTAPEPSPGPLERGEGPVFGCFNNPRKIGPETVRLWAEAVKAVPGARLLLKAQQFGDAAAASRMRERFVAAGLSPDQVEVLGRPTFAEGFAMFSTIDVALDPFPYHGTTSTCEAFWMGVPVVTLPGRTCVSRVGPSLLRRVGLDDLVARDAAHFRDIAAGLMRDRARLADLRRTLRGRMAGSPLAGGPVFARQFEAAYRTMWQRWCATANGA
jgi:predicted O-linked N-acetylglucosamine transferase (SPINDLY family)